MKKIKIKYDQTWYYDQIWYAVFDARGFMIAMFDFAVDAEKFLALKKADNYRVRMELVQIEGVK